MEHQYPWQQAFEQITAGDPRTLPVRIQEAERLLCSRFEELAGSLDNQVEKQALRQSIMQLGRIQIEKLGYPDWRNSA
jgi:hypothetical protein